MIPVVGVDNHSNPTTKKKRKAMKTVKEILIANLKLNGYDGLSNGEIQCCCKTEELALCEDIHLECQPGYLVTCPEIFKGKDYCIGGKPGRQCKPDECGDYACGWDGEPWEGETE
jgi:hypothetical protein